LVIILVLTVSFVAYAVSWEILSMDRSLFLKSNYMDYTLPSKITGPASLEFKGMVSDFLFLKMITFLGEKISKHERFNEKHWQYLRTTVETITDLDPYFWDPYLFADMLLTWEAGKIEEANNILFKAMKYRTWDYRVPYYIGFNYFFFLRDNIKGAKYLMQASKLPHSPAYLPNLAARLSFYGVKTKTAILFLKKMSDEVSNPSLRNRFELRIKTLEIIDFLEAKVKIYKKRYGHIPSSLQTLVKVGLLKEIPRDPYGGKFLLLKNGRVYTTSKMLQRNK